MTNILDVLQENLTGEQYLAATDSSPEVLTLACAGSGKSRTLAYRIAWLIAEGANPRNIVAFTFTEKAAESIKRRVADALRKVGFSPTILGAMYIGTIHSYCNYLLGLMDARYLQFDVLDENRLKLFLMSRWPELGLRELRSARGEKYFNTVKQVSDAWQTINDEMISLETVALYDATLGTCLHSLRTRLDIDEFIDFSYMIRLVVDALQTGDTRMQNSITIDHLMVDEYQDVNPAQEYLISELYKRAKSLFVVGDDDQAIYGWRGANVNNILTFRERYPNASSHTLSHNYRCSEAIVSASDAFARDELGAIRMVKNPTADSPSGTRDFRKLWFNDRLTEANWVADKIQTLLGTRYVERDGSVRGLTPADFAILMRTTRSNARHEPFTQALAAQGIDYSLESGGSIFDRAEVAVLREGFELLRDESPDRDTVQRFFDERILPIFPDASFDLVTKTYSNWGRLIHSPIEGARRRVYPQQLVHDLLSAFGIARTSLSDGTMQDLGMFSRIMQDVEVVYVSIDSAARFQDILNFLQNVAESGYDTSTNDILLRPDTVTVSTVHKVKGLEFPVVFIVDVENERFPSKRQPYKGWLPNEVMKSALERGAYQGTREEETRLFYTAMTRAERYLYITGCARMPDGKKVWKESPFTQRLQHSEIETDPHSLPTDLVSHTPSRRIEDEVFPTSFTDLRSYMLCPRNYQFRKMYGFSPPVPALFGFGQTVHTSISRLHQQFPDNAPPPNETQRLIDQTFHLKHLFPSNDPINNLGPYEQAKKRARQIIGNYVGEYGSDFARSRQVEVRFEIPVAHAIISGSIDLLLKESSTGEILDARIIDFKTFEGGENVIENEKLDWAQLSLQVQLYAKAAIDVLAEKAKTGAIHTLVDNQRIDVPIENRAIEAAVANVEWVVDRILESDFPMRPFHRKCSKCDFVALCNQTPEEFESNDEPPMLYTPAGRQKIRAIVEYEGQIPTG